MTTNNLGVAPRDRVGKGGARASRREGLVPGVIYGDGRTPIAISLNLRALAVEMNRPGFMTRLFDFDVGGANERVLCRAVQRHPVNDRAVHVDFLRVGATSRIHVRVPVHFINQDRSPGLKKGGVLNVVAHEIEIVCNANSIPEGLNVDLSGIEIGHSIHLDHVPLPEGAAIAAREGGHLTIATIVAPTVQAADPAAAAAPAAAATGAKPAS